MPWAMRRGKLSWAKAHRWDHPGVRFREGVLVSRELLELILGAPFPVAREFWRGLWTLRPEDNTMVIPPSSGKLWLREREIIRKTGGKNSVRWMVNPAYARAGGGARPLDLWDAWEKLMGKRQGGQDGIGSDID